MAQQPPRLTINRVYSMPYTFFKLVINSQHLFGFLLVRNVGKGKNKKSNTLHKPINRIVPKKRATFGVSREGMTPSFKTHAQM